MWTFLQPLVKEYPSYLRDSKHLMNLLKNVPVESDKLLVAIYTKSLYTSLRQHDVLKTNSKALVNKSDLRKEQIQKNVILDSLELAMTNNYFWHDGDYYNQIKGVAMGAKYAPSPANFLLSQ